MVMQGRKVGEADIGLIRDWLAAHPEWNRTRLSQELCACWNWRNAQGRAKDMAARTLLLLKLERAGYIRLPARRGPSAPNRHRNRQIDPVAPPEEPICDALRALLPLGVSVVAPGSDDARVFKGLLAHEMPAWVQVPHLASHVLALIARRIRADWQAKYGHPGSPSCATARCPSITTSRSAIFG